MDYEYEYYQLLNRIVKLNEAKGRYHTQLAITELFEYCGLPAVCPQQNNKGNK